MPSPVPSLIQTKFTKGIDQSVDYTATPDGSLWKANNVTYVGGAFVRRYGFNKISSGLTTSTRMMWYKNQLLQSDGYSLSSLYSSNKFTVVDSVSPVVATGDPIAGLASGGIYQADHGLVGGIHFTAILGPNVISGTSYRQIFLYARDATTMAPVKTAVLLSSAGAVNYSMVRMVTTAANAYVLAFRSDGNLVGWQITTTGVVNISAEHVMSSASLTGLSTAGFDVCATNATGTWLLNVVFSGTSAGNVYMQTVQYGETGNWWIAAGSFLSGGTIPNHPVSVACAVSGNNLDISYHHLGSGNIYLMQVALSNPSTVVSAAHVVISGANTISSKLTVTPTSGGQALVMYTLGGTYAYNAKNIQYIYAPEANVALSDNPKYLYNFMLVSRPFVVNDPTGATVTYAHVEEMDRYQDTPPSAQGSQFLIRLPAIGTSGTTQPTPVAMFAPREANGGNMSINSNMSANAVAVSPTQFYVLTEVAPVPNQNNELWLTTLDFKSSNNLQFCSLGDQMYLASGMPSVYDGARVGEINFASMPDAPTLTNVSVGSGHMAAGTYQYQICYEYIDARGYKVRSSPSKPVSITAAANSSVQIQCPALHLTSLQRQISNDTPYVSIAIFRTQVGLADTFYRVFQETYTSNPLSNFPENQWVTVTDDTPDATLTTSSFGFLYTVGGELPDRCPPSLTSIISHKGRIWGIGWDKRTVWYSKQISVGVQPGFHENLTFSIDDDGLPVTALASLEDSLLIFKEHTIYAVNGDGPADNGQGNDLTVPRPVQTDLGCINQRSIVKVPTGIFFQSRKGIQFITRGLEVQYPGYAVQQELTMPIVSAAQIEQDNVVVFWLSDGTNSKAIVYDYNFDVWVTWTLTSGSAVPIADSVDYLGSHYMCDSNGNIYYQNRTSWQDWGGGYYATLETAWMFPAGPMGFANVHQAALSALPNVTNGTTGGLSVKVLQDFNTTPTNTFSWQKSDVSSAAGAFVTLTPTRAECNCVKLIFSDQNGTGSGPATDAGYTFTGFGMYVSPEPGFLRVPSTMMR